MNNESGRVFHVTATRPDGSTKAYGLPPRYDGVDNKFTRNEAWDKVEFLRSFTDVERIEVFKDGVRVYEETVYDYTDAERKFK